MKLRNFPKSVFIFLFAPALMAPKFITAEDVYENISLSKYDIEPSCTYSKYGQHRLYAFKLSSKYSMFTNYDRANQYSYSGASELIIDNELYKFTPSFRVFNRSDIEFTIDEDVMDKLIKSKRFTVFYPTNIFDSKWLDKTYSKVHRDLPRGVYGGDVYLYSKLSSQNLSQYKKLCDDQIKVSFDAFQESERPVNRLKRFFGMD